MLQIIMRRVEIGSAVGDSLLQLSVTVQHLCVALQSPFTSPNTESENLRSRISHVNWELLSKLLYFI